MSGIGSYDFIPIEDSQMTLSTSISLQRGSATWYVDILMTDPLDSKDGHVHFVVHPFYIEDETSADNTAGMTGKLNAAGARYRIPMPQANRVVGWSVHADANGNIVEDDALGNGHTTENSSDGQVFRLQLQTPDKPIFVYVCVYKADKPQNKRRMSIDCDEDTEYESTLAQKYDRLVSELEGDASK